MILEVRSSEGCAEQLTTRKTTTSEKPPLLISMDQIDTHWNHLHWSHCGTADHGLWGCRKTHTDFSIFAYHWGLSSVSCAAIVRNNQFSQMLDQLMFNEGVISQMEAKALCGHCDRKQDNAAWQIFVEENWGHAGCLCIVQPYAIIKTLDRRSWEGWATDPYIFMFQFILRQILILEGVFYNLLLLSSSNALIFFSSLILFVLCLYLCSD